MGLESFWQTYMGNVRFCHAERALAFLAVEVDVALVMAAMSGVLAKLIVHHPAPVLEGVHHIVLKKERQHTEYA